MAKNRGTYRSLIELGEDQRRYNEICGIDGRLQDIENQIGRKSPYMGFHPLQDGNIPFIVDCIHDLKYWEHVLELGLYGD